MAKKAVLKKAKLIKKTTFKFTLYGGEAKLAEKTIKMAKRGYECDDENEAFYRIVQSWYFWQK